jgi:hypothetical protein
MAQQKRLTLEGNIVISVGLFGHTGDNEVWTEGTKEMLDEMHKRKIDMADEIFVIDVSKYIGSSTKSEIDYAIKTGKPVKYLSNLEISLEELIRKYPNKFGVVGSEYIIKVLEEKGNVLHVYIRPSDRDGETLDFWIKGNGLLYFSDYKFFDKTNEIAR